MMLADLLSAFGHKVDGPYSRFSDAMLAAKSNNLQAGILDVNLGSEKNLCCGRHSRRPENSFCLRHRLRARQHRFRVFPRARAAKTGRGCKAPRVAPANRAVIPHKTGSDCRRVESLSSSAGQLVDSGCCIGPQRFGNLTELNSLGPVVAVTCKRPRRRAKTKFHTKHRA